MRSCGMLGRRGAILAIGLAAGAGCLVRAQQSADRTGAKDLAAKAVLPVREIDLTHVEPLPGLPTAYSTGLAFCSSDGSAWMDIYASAIDKDGHALVLDFPEMYRISETREVKRVWLKKPAEYTTVALLSRYATPGGVAGLVYGFGSTEPDGSKKQVERYFLSTANEDVGSAQLVELTLPFMPMRIAMFETGELLALGADDVNLQAKLAQLNPDGSLQRMMDLDSHAFAASESLKKVNAGKPKLDNTTAKMVLLDGALNQAVFVPWGDEILLVQPGTKLPVYRLGSSGKQEPVMISLPDGWLLSSILGSAGEDKWVVVAQTVSAFEKIARREVTENMPTEVFEVDPYTGTVLDRLEVNAPSPRDLVCGAHGKLSSIGFMKGGEQIGYASAVR